MTRNERGEGMIHRHSKILEILTEHKKIEVAKLAALIHVSQVTARRDLDQLEAQGLVYREHGYALIGSHDDMNNRLAYHYDTKKAIAAAAAACVANGETVMIESGSCCAMLAAELAATKRDVTIISNSAFIADYVRKFPGIKMVLLGGEFQPESQVMVGPITRKCAEEFYVDKLFIGADGYTEKSGFTSKDRMRAEAVKDMAKQAANVIVLTESEKFSKQGVVSLIDTGRASKIYTDSDISKGDEAHLRDQGVEVIKIIKK